jgi:hypothetical protein
MRDVGASGIAKLSGAMGGVIHGRNCGGNGDNGFSNTSSVESTVAAVTKGVMH